MKKTFIFIVLALAVFFCTSVCYAEVTDEDVKQAIAKGVDYVKTQQGLNGSFTFSSWPPGPTCLAVLALLNCDVKPDDPSIVKAVDYINKHDPNRVGTYACGLMAMVYRDLYLYDSVKYADYKLKVEKCAAWLVKAQGADGSWSYRGGANGDNSNCQYAVLGLQAAKECGVVIPQDTWDKILKCFHSRQGSDGGWGYRAASRGTGVRGTGAMTTAGLSSLFIANSQLDHAGKKCGEYKFDKHLVAGINWMAKQFSVKVSPGGGQHYYYLYGLERAGIYSAQKYFGSHDWYREGAEYLVSAQQMNGSWERGGAARGRANCMQTCFALLFLGKGKAPVLFNKLKYKTVVESDWNNDHNDIKNLTKRCKKELEVSCSWQVVNLEGDIEELLKAPILYFNGHSAPNWGDKEIKKIRDFIDYGGFIYAEACCGNKEFDKAFRDIIQKALPKYELKLLPKEHVIYDSKYKIPENKKNFYGLNTGCRLSVLYSPVDTSCTWNGENEDEVNWQIGVNVAAYMLECKPMMGKLKKLKVDVVDREEKVLPGSFVISQLRHQGDWDPHNRAHLNLLKKLGKEVNMRVGISREEVVPRQNDMFRFPVVYMVGHNEFEYEDGDYENLRKYLKNGGFLFAEACCGRTQFDKSFREFAIKLFENDPKLQLKKIPLDHLIYKIGGREIKEVKYWPAVLKENPNLKEPTLEGIELNGRLVLVYSKYALGCGWEGHPPTPNGKGYEKEDALELSTNIIIYAMTQ